MNTLLAPPLPKSPEEIQRVEHSRLRRRVLYNLHAPDVEARLVRTVGTIRADAWPPPDMTSNPARHIFSQLAGLYRRSPEVTPPEGGEMVAAAIAESGYWQLAQRVQRDTLALNDTMVHISIVDDEPVFRLVWPDYTQVTVDPRNPAVVVAVREWVSDPADPARWVLLHTDPRIESHWAEDEAGEDVTQRVLGAESFSGAAYPWRVDGVAVLPYVRYSAAETGFAYDPFSGAEVFEGSLQLCVYYTMLAHVMADASWAQRYAVGAEPVGSDLDSNGSKSEIVTDPATVLLLGVAPDFVGQPVVSQWATPVDPAEFLSAIERYERRVVEMALGTVGVSRRESDVRSAASLAVSREAQREAQRAFEPLFHRSDMRLLALTAGLLDAPTEGWRISYKSLPKDPAELAASMDQIVAQIAAGLMDKATAYQQLNPGLTRAEAVAAVAAIAADAAAE